jgi:hypothetical protein
LVSTYDNNWRAVVAAGVQSNAQVLVFRLPRDPPVNW